MITKELKKELKDTKQGLKDMHSIIDQ